MFLLHAGSQPLVESLVEGFKKTSVSVAAGRGVLAATVDRHVPPVGGARSEEHNGRCIDGSLSHSLAE